MILMHLEEKEEDALDDDAVDQKDKYDFWSQISCHSYIMINDDAWMQFNISLPSSFA